MLTSTQNPRVRDAAALHRARERRRRGLHLADGPNAVSAAIDAGLADTVFVDASSADLARWIRSDGPEVVPVDGRVLRHLSDSVTPQSVVAVVRSSSVDLGDLVARLGLTGIDRRCDARGADDGSGATVAWPGALLVVDRVSDPGNLGTILRTARAFGVVGVALTQGCADVFGPKTIRATAGTVYGLPVAADVTPGEVVHACRAARIRLVGLSATGETDLLDAVRSSGESFALVVGSEAHGIDGEFEAALDVTARIPMREGVESLNVAVAAGIALYLASRPPDPSEPDPAIAPANTEWDGATP